MHCECLSTLLCILSEDHCQKNRTEQQFSLGPYRKTFFSCPHLIFLMNKFKFETVSLVLSAERQWDLRSFHCTCDALYIQPSGRERQQVSGGAGGLAESHESWWPGRGHSKVTPLQAAEADRGRRCHAGPFYFTLSRNHGVHGQRRRPMWDVTAPRWWPWSRSFGSGPSQDSVNESMTFFQGSLEELMWLLVTSWRRRCGSPASPALAAGSMAGPGGHFLATLTGNYRVVGRR